MKSKASAPGKVILFGEHFVVYGIKAVLCAINKRITVTAEKVDGDKISIKSNIGNLELGPNK
ncbi:MAG: mevalonate kinase, partial [Nitrosopumilus sp.]|nr:mevalonate kinase [Nitrosopumilus sp.]